MCRPARPDALFLCAYRARVTAARRPACLRSSGRRHAAPAALGESGGAAQSCAHRIAGMCMQPSSLETDAITWHQEQGQGGDQGAPAHLSMPSAAAWGTAAVPPVFSKVPLCATSKSLTQALRQMQYQLVPTARPGCTKHGGLPAESRAAQRTSRPLRSACCVAVSSITDATPLQESTFAGDNVCTT